MKKLSDDLSTSPTIRIINNPLVINRYSLYLTEEISEQSNYHDMINLLRESSPDDQITIYVHNRGGYLSSGIDLINAIRSAKAQILIRMTGPCYSMAPLIVLSGQNIIIEPYAFMMFHDYSDGIEGKGNELEIQLRHEKPHFDNLFRELTAGFLTHKETNNIINGKDLYLGRDDIQKRLLKLKRLVQER